MEDPTRPYEVWTDTSTVGIGAVLLQRDENGQPQVIAYESKRLLRKLPGLRGRPSGTSPASIEVEKVALEDASGKQELTAVIHALNVWRHYLEGAEFTVLVDHNPLR